MKSAQDSEISFYQDRLAFKDLVSVLERKSKHRALSECQRLIWQITILQSLIREAGNTPPPFEFKTYAELVGDEEEQIEKLSMERLQPAVKTTTLTHTTSPP